MHRKPLTMLTTNGRIFASSLFVYTAEASSLAEPAPGAILLRQSCCQLAEHFEAVRQIAGSLAAYDAANLKPAALETAVPFWRGVLVDI